MTDSTSSTSPLIYARLAGLMYIVTIILGVFSVNYVACSLIVPGNDTATVNNIMENESLFRVGIATEILMYLLVVVLAFSLYVVLSTVNRNLALLALLWRLCEAIVGAGTTVLSGLIPLLLINSGTAFEAEQLGDLVGLFLGVRSAGLDIVLIFIGAGGTVFCYLFYKSRYVPRILAAWGMFTYITMFVISFASILSANITEATKLAFYAPGGLFELIFGFWLLIKAVNIEKQENPAL